MGTGLTGTGTSGGDKLISSGGPNTLVGLGGDDVYIVNNTGDAVTEAANGGSDTVIATVSYTIPDNVEALYVLGAGADRYRHGRRRQVCSAAAGRIRWWGSAATTSTYVNNTGDVVTEAANGGSDVVIATVSYALPDNVEALYVWWARG